MSNITILIGIGLFSFLLVYMIFKLSNRDGVGEEGFSNSKKRKGHFLLQLLLLFFLIGNVFLIGKIVYDDKDHCAYLAVNSTLSGSTTSYDYDYVCTENSNNTALIFYRGITWFVICLMTYIFIYFVYEVLEYLGYVVPK